MNDQCTQPLQSRDIWTLSSMGILYWNICGVNAILSNLSDDHEIMTRLLDYNLTSKKINTAYI